MNQEERIKGMYNDAWKIYKEYLLNRNVEQFTQGMRDLILKYDCKSDIEGLAFWWSARVQGVHDEYMRISNEKRG